MVPGMATVRPADAGEVPALSAVLAQAFTGEALMNWLLPQRTRRVARRELMFTLELQTYVLPQEGLVFTADDGRSGGLVGGCSVLPPDRWQMPDAAEGRTAVRWLLALGMQLPRAIRHKRALQEHHPTEPHYYIRCVGVRPALQGQGLGSARDAADARALRQ
jgi:ribosomal protein S18 acetylase RimI-like enzyme